MTEVFQGRIIFRGKASSLPNGNTVVAAYTSKFPIFEVTPAKKVVWKFKNPAVGNPTHVKLLTPAELDGFMESAGK